ncbi:MAG: NUDIX hydrolase [bacterium]
MNIFKAIKDIDEQVADASQGLPEELFFLISRLVPMVNVDLLIKDEKGRILLAWRDDQYAGIGWHLPGGIVRFKEKLEKRIDQVALTEIGQAVSFEPVPLAMNQVICEHEIRGHFISILYKCSLPGQFIPKNAGLTNKDPGFLKWHEACPENLVKVHEMYRKYV